MYNSIFTKFACGMANHFDAMCQQFVFCAEYFILEFGKREEKSLRFNKDNSGEALMIILTIIVALNLALKSLRKFTKAICQSLALMDIIGMESVELFTTRILFVQAMSFFAKLI